MTIRVTRGVTFRDYDYWLPSGQHPEVQLEEGVATDNKPAECGPELAATYAALYAAAAAEAGVSTAWEFAE